MKKFLRTGSLATIAIAALVLTGCNAGDPEPEPTPTESASDERVELAQEEGQLTWYSGTSPDAAATVAEAFEDEYGITVTVVRLTSSQIAQRFQSELDAGSVEADVLSTVDVTFFNNMAESGDIRPLTDDELGEIPRDFLINDATVQFSAAPVTVPFNTDALGEDGISSWDDLLDPSLKGTLILADPRGSRAWAQLWTMLLNHPDMGEEFLKGVAEQDFRLIDSAATAPDMLAAGEGEAVIAAVISNIQALVDAGAPLKNWIVSDPGFVIPTYVTITTDAPRPNAASLFVEWLASAQGSSVYNAAEKAVSPIGDLPGTIPAPGGIEPMPSPEQIEEDLPKILELLGIS